MRDLFRNIEFDKINNELLNKFYPVDALNSFYIFGVAQAFNSMTDIANEYINNGNADKLDAYDLKKLINESMTGNKELKELYGRLRKNGIEVE